MNIDKRESELGEVLYLPDLKTCKEVVFPAAARRLLAALRSHGSEKDRDYIRVSRVLKLQARSRSLAVTAR